MKHSFQNAAVACISLGDVATAYVFYSPDNTGQGRILPENIAYESSDTGLYGGERHDTDFNTKSPQDCAEQAARMVAAMPRDGNPRVVVFVHEPRLFDYNSDHVARQLAGRGVPSPR